LLKLANATDWSEFEEAFGKLFDPKQGGSAKPIRLIVGLRYLKQPMISAMKTWLLDGLRIRTGTFAPVLTSSTSCP
jgi:hypothetical protein